MRNLLGLALFMGFFLSGCSSQAPPAVSTDAPPPTNEPSPARSVEAALPPRSGSAGGGGGGGGAAAPRPSAAPTPRARKSAAGEAPGYRAPPKSREDHLEGTAAVRSQHGARAPGATETPGQGLPEGEHGALLYEGPPEKMPPDLLVRPDVVMERGHEEGKDFVRIFEPPIR